MSLCLPWLGSSLHCSPSRGAPRGAARPSCGPWRQAAACAALGVARRRDATQMMRWLQGLGAQGLDRISVAPRSGGLGVVAREDLAEGQVVCSIPGPAILTGAGADEAALAERLLAERRRGQESFFEPYISLLPREVPKSHPLMWPKGMEPEQLLAGSVHGKQVAEDLLSAGCSNLQQLMSHGFGEAESRWALVIVDTRAFTFQLGTEEEQLALVPLLDLFNNRTNRQLWQCSFEPEGSVEEGALLLAERSIEAKEEIFHLYNDNSSAMLWMVYGFLEESENLFECAGLEVDLTCGGELAEAKMAAVRSYLRAQDSSVASGRVVLELPKDAEDGGEMMPLARRLASTTPAELQRAAQRSDTPGREDLSLELKARRLVVQWLQQAVANLDEAAATAELQGSRCAGSEEGELWRSAWRLLQLERPILTLELEASERFLAEGAKALSEDGFEAFVAAQWSDSGWMGAG